MITNQETISNNLDGHDTQDPAQITVVNTKKKSEDVFISSTDSVHLEHQNWFSENIDSSFYDESYVELLDTINPDFAEIRNIELDNLLERIDNII